MVDRSGCITPTTVRCKPDARLNVIMVLELLHRATETIDLRNFVNSNAGVVAIAKALEKNTCCTKLDLSGNHIGNAGAHALAEALKKNTSLRFLGLRANKIGYSGLLALAEAVETNESLTSLQLGLNPLPRRQGKLDLQKRIGKKLKLNQKSRREEDEKAAEEARLAAEAEKKHNINFG